MTADKYINIKNGNGEVYQALLKAGNSVNKMSTKVTDWHKCQYQLESQPWQDGFYAVHKEPKNCEDPVMCSGIIQSHQVSPPPGLTATNEFVENCFEPDLPPESLYPFKVGDIVAWNSSGDYDWAKGKQFQLTKEIGSGYYARGSDDKLYILSKVFLHRCFKVNEFQIERNSTMSDNTVLTKPEDKRLKSASRYSRAGFFLTLMAASGAGQALLPLAKSLAGWLGNALLRIAG